MSSLFVIVGFLNLPLKFVGRCGTGRNPTNIHIFEVRNRETGKNTKIFNDTIRGSLLSTLNIFRCIFLVLKQVHVSWEHFTNDSVEKLIFKDACPKARPE